MANNSHHLNMHQHQLHHSAVHHLSPHLQHQQNQQLQQAHAQQQQLQHNQLIAQQSIQHQLNNQAHNVSQHQHNLTPPNSHFTSAMMGNSSAANAAILLPPSPYGSDKSGDLSPNEQSAAYLEQHGLHNEQLLNSSGGQPHGQRNQHSNQLHQLHYSRAANLTSPQSSPSSVVNLHSPTISANIIQSLNGMPASPAVSPVHCDKDGDQQTVYNAQQLHQQHLAHHPHLSFAGNPNSLHERGHASSNSGQIGNSLLSKLSGQPITVLQSAVNTGVITQNNQQALRITPVSSLSGSTPCTNSNSRNSNLISNLASAIVSTPVAVVTHSAHHHQQQLAIDCKPKLNSTSSSQMGSSSASHHALHLASPNGGSNSATSTGDEGEEINTKDLAQRISAELKRYSIPQAIFAQRVLCRSQGTLSDLLRNPKPWSKLKSGRETFRRMHKWLEEPEFQRMSTLRLAGKWCFFAFRFFRSIFEKL